MNNLSGAGGQGTGEFPGKDGDTRVDTRPPEDPRTARAWASAATPTWQRDGQPDGSPEQEQNVPGAHERPQAEGGHQDQADRHRAEECSDAPVVGAVARHPHVGQCRQPVVPSVGYSELARLLTGIPVRAPPTNPDRHSVPEKASPSLAHASPIWYDYKEVVFFM